MRLGMSKATDVVKEGPMPAPREAAADRPPDGHDLLEMHAWLACLGPESFQPAMAWSRLAPDTERGVTLDWLLDPANRNSASIVIGTRLAGSLAARGRDAVPALGGLLPSLVAADAAAGFDVLRQAALAVPVSSARDFGEALMTLALAEGTAVAGSDDLEPETHRHRDHLGCLLEALAALDLPPEGRARLFLALSQTLHPSLVRDLVVPTSMFPASPAEGATVLAEGTDEAVRALIHGALTRTRGRAEFFEACRAALDVGLEAGLPVIGRVARLLNGAGPTARTLESLVRGAVLPALEKGAHKVPGIARRVPADADVWTLRLLAVVVPALPEPHRTALCDTIIARAGDRLRASQVGTVDADAFVEAVVGAAVLHSDPEVPSAEVRRMLLHVAGSLRVQLFSAERPPEALFDVSMAFERIAVSLGTEFRRRQSLASALTSVLPIVSNLSTPREAHHPSWAD